MKISYFNVFRKNRRNQSGVAVIVMLALLALILIYILANVRSLNTLQKELQLINRHQLNHWKTLDSTPVPGVSTNAISPTNQPSSTRSSS